LVIVVFAASVTRMIPLYALGVFTSFTLSQTGMAKRHLRIKEEGWRRGLVINGVGALTTGVVTLISAFEKFTKGAWIVVVFVPIMVALLVRVNHTYEAEDADLMEGLERVHRPLPRRHLAIVLVNQIDGKTLHAVQYALTIRPQEIKALHLTLPDEDTSA